MQDEQRALLYLFINFFSYFLENKSQYPELTPAMISKLRHLTIVSLATKDKVSTNCIHYSVSQLLRDIYHYIIVIYHRENLIDWCLVFSLPFFCEHCMVVCCH